MAVSCISDHQRRANRLRARGACTADCRAVTAAGAEAGPPIGWGAAV